MARRGRGIRRQRRSSGLNLLVAINKPLGMVTRALDNEACDALEDDGVGHIGTLDPAVTGVVVLCVGQARKLISLLENGKRKSYAASVAFGRQTDTDDAEGNVILDAPVPEEVGDPRFARTVIDSLVGEREQVPPKFSAIKVNGVRAYERARAGEDFTLPPRRIHIYEAKLHDVRYERQVVWDCEFDVSAGTYIRAIARDLGTAVGSAAHLCALRRTADGNVGLEDCISLEQLKEAGATKVGAFALDPSQVLGLPVHRLVEGELDSVRNGRFLEAPALLKEHDGQLVSLVYEGRLYGVWRSDHGMLRPHTNCPLGVEGVRV